MASPFDQIGNFIGPYSDSVLAIIIIVGALIAIKIAFMVIGRLKRGVKAMGGKNLYVNMLDALKQPISLGIFLLGVYLALRSLTALAPFSGDMASAFAVIFSFYLAYFAAKIVGIFIDWYAVEIAEKTKTTLDDQFLPIIKRAAYGIIFGIVIIIMLNQLGVRVETLIATLGIGGLAVALALQPTLANFFSGMQMVLDRPLRIGDFVELDAGERGTVVDIGWRSTKIRTYMNNIVTIPNSKLSDSKITNFNTPSPEIGFSIDCGVAYDSDLDKVERVSIEVATEIIEKYSGVNGFKPVFRFREFGDSSINFKVVMRTKTLADSYLATHEFIKALKKRFDREGIGIAFPQVDVHMDKPRARPARKSPARQKRKGGRR
ncbi:MAG: mechanosensitive ion channel family protein [Candidatus Aenigmarchaeota archaeon]|nr:mechanosensitive ion channel family protein [Candidatus Aenigmarchaeota archaeon]